MSKFITPPDWDSPSEENEDLCRKFRPFDFSADIKYRLYSPKHSPNAAVSPIPLVVFLHGADAFGSDNYAQLSIHDIGTMFSTDAWQSKHPCRILCPQSRRGRHWSLPGVLNELNSLIDRVISESSGTTHPVDEKRIYIYGYSAGAFGLMELIKLTPRRFAGAVPICGAVVNKDIDRLSQTPMWLVHAADDKIVKVSYGEDSPSGTSYYLGSREINKYLKDHGSAGVHYTEYPAGYMKKTYAVNPHCTWVCVSGQEGAPIREWLFEQYLKG